jgi:hypothetical protein
MQLKLRSNTDTFGEITPEQANKVAEKSTGKHSWEDLRFSEKAKLFSYWSIIICISNIF